MKVETEKLLAIKVITRMNLTPSSPRQCPQETMRNIKRALATLEPFKPAPVARMMVNNFLCAYGANAVDCLKAWALYLDFYHIEIRRKRSAMRAA